MSSALRPATADCAPPRRQCFWSYREDAEITEDKIPFVIRGLREHGGLAGYEIAAELCHYALSSKAGSPLRRTWVARSGRAKSPAKLPGLSVCTGAKEAIGSSDI
jgi:hypothetical protein